MFVSAAFFGGCAQPPLSPGKYEVDPPRAAFFKNGPAQGTPDVSLSRGDRVEVMESQRGFSRVRLADGREGYISSAALRTARAEAAPRASAAGKPVQTRAELREPAASEEPPLLPVATEGVARPRFRF